MRYQLAVQRNQFLIEQKRRAEYYNYRPCLFKAFVCAFVLSLLVVDIGFMYLSAVDPESFNQLQQSIEGNSY